MRSLEDSLLMSGGVRFKEDLVHRTLLLALVALLICTNVQSQRSALSEAGQIAAERLKVQEALLEKEFERLRKSLALGNESAPPAFDEAKATWLKFRKQYCFAISQAFGGAYAGPHDSECQAKLAADFIKEMQERTW
jgi:uncharacterized protein YecT (DUF1311 family)